MKLGGHWDSLMDMFKNSYTARFSGMKSMAQQFSENFLAKVAPNDTLNVLLEKNAKQKNQVLEFLDAFKQRVLTWPNLRIFWQNPSRIE